MHQTTLERIEQELKKIKRQLQCGTQFFETVEEFPEVGVPCAIYVDKSSGAFYVYDTATSTYITADAGEDVDFSLTTTGTSGPATLVGTILNIPQYQGVLTNPVTGTGTAGQVSYWSGTGTQTGSNNLFWDNANGRLGVKRTDPVVEIDVIGNIRSSNVLYTQTAQITNIQLNTGVSSLRILNNPGTVYMAMFATTGNFLLQNGGTFTDGGHRLQVNGSTLLRGSGTTSSTTALLVQNSTPTELFKIRDDGNANFGTGMYWDNANGRLGIGPNAPAAPLHTTSVNGEYVNAIFQYSDTSIYGGNLIVRKSRGSNSSPTAVLQNDRLGALGFAGYDGSIWNNSAVIFANADENWSASNRGSRFTFELTPNGSTSRVERMRITNTGNVLIGNTDGTGRLTVRGSGTTSSTTALLVQNSAATELLKVADNGAWNFNGDGIVKGSGNTSGTTALTVQNSGGTNLFRVSNDNGILIGTRPAATIYPTAFGSVYNINGRGIAMSFVASDTAYEPLTLTHGNFTTTADGYIIVNTIGTFNPTSGTATYTGNRIGSTINQTGGANGITRGLYVNPTLTAAADWRGVEITTSTVNTVVLGKNTGSAAVEVTSTTQGFLPPRLTTAQRDLIASPAAGLVIFNTTTTKLECFDGAVWQAAW